MRTVKFTNLAIFVLFFGIALLEAFRNSNRIEAILFFALAIISVWADIRKN